MAVEKAKQENKAVEKVETKQEVVKEVVKSERQLQQEKTARLTQKYYNGFPTIKGGIVEFDGLPVARSSFYTKFKDGNGNIRISCMCGHCQKNGIDGVKVLYVPHRNVFVCDTAGCERSYSRRFGGYERLVCWHFFNTEAPYAGAGEPIPDENDPLIVNA